VAVSATELRPRGPLALFDAAIRLTARTQGAWALTLPGGAAVTWAVLHLSDAAYRGSSLLLPSLWFTLAWLFRGVCQGATCHHLDALILGEAPVSARRSFRAALGRLPSLLTAAVYLPLFNLASLTVTFGLGYFLLASHLAGFAAVMKGKGHPLALYTTCSRLLGPARTSAPVVRMLFWVMVLLGLNLHIGATVLVYLGRKLLGLELTFAQRFVAFDNGAWIAVVVALTFVLFEPLRAAVGTLLLIDGRVRQEGLDLLAAVEQLPRRHAAPVGRSLRAGSGALVVALGLCGVLSPSPAHAQAPAGPLQRLRAAADACGLDEGGLQALQGTERLGPAEQASLRRLADEVELFAVTWGDCDEAEARLEQALPLLARTLQAMPPEGRDAQARAQDILARPEFAERAARPVAAAEDVPDDHEVSWWGRFTQWLAELLEKLFKTDPATPRATPAMGGGMGAANFLVVLLLAAVAVLAGVLLYLAFRNRERVSGAVEVEEAALGAQAAGDANHALSRPPEGWAALADELAAQGRFREAVRSLYLALLSRLHRAGAIDYDPTLSNWDYCRRFRGRREWLPTFRDLTHRFDFAWYGVAEVEQPGYLHFRSLTEPLLRPEPDERARPGGDARG
jgi:tetratricopeptide (TPR) repeat protein